MNEWSYLGSRVRVWGGDFLESLVFIHFPFGLGPTGSSTIIENHGSLDPNGSIIPRVNDAWWTSGLPVAGTRQAAGSPSSCFFLLSRNEKEPLLQVSLTTFSSIFCFQNIIYVRSIYIYRSKLIMANKKQ